MLDVVCLGESLLTLRPTAPGQSLGEASAFHRGIGGAESNVACALAAAGHRVRWVSRLGVDGFGDHLLRTIAAAGVDVSLVARDPGRPTGVYFRTDGEGDGKGSRGEAAYYRAGSAASAMSTANVPRAAWANARLLHLTGITAALSADCLALLRELASPAADRPPVSFDVNYRPALWHGRDGAAVLLELARAADLVFVGEDEAEALWGITGGPQAVRAALPDPDTVVVKQGSAGATVFSRRDAGTASEPAPMVEVVAPVGAGDAFAAGYLSAQLRGLPPTLRLRHGHLMAAAVLTTAGDVAPPPARERADRLAALPADEWAALRLAPGWVQAPEPAP